MSDITLMLSLSLTIFAAHFIGALTGFGCTVLALPFTISLIGMDCGKPVLTVVGLIQCLVVAISQFKDINWVEVKKIVFYVAIGMPIGLICYRYLPEDILITILSILMLMVSVKGILELKGYKFKSPKNYLLNFLLFFGGIIHGAFVSGGPLLMIYSTEKIKDKDTFRATMCIIWVILNTFLILDGAFSGIYTSTVLMYIMIALPSLFIGIWLANKLTCKVNQRMFNYIIYMVLGTTAIFNFI